MFVTELEKLWDNMSLLTSLGGAFVILILLLVAAAVSTAFSPRLRHFPGPFLAKFSSLWLVMQCRRTRRSEAVLQQHQRYGDFVRVAPNHISINSPEGVAQIYGHKTGFAKSDFYDAFLQVTPVVFNARNIAVHHRKRKYLNPAFSMRALAEFEPDMDVELLGWKNRLLQMVDVPQKSAEVDFAVWSSYLAFDVIGSFAFGRSFGFVERGYDPYNLIDTITTRGEVLNALGAVPTYLRPWMRYYYLDPFWSSGLRATANLERIGREAYHQRKDAAAAGGDRKDLLSFLFAARDNDTKEAVPENEIVAESISFIVGGSDTTSSTITNVIDFAARDRPLQKKLQLETDTTFPGEQALDWIPAEKIVVEMPLMVATLREVMRVRPISATGLERLTPQGGRTVAGKFVPEGTVVSVPTCGVMNDPRLFKNPAQFRPERWLEPGANKLLDYFLPFSTGPRACIGRNFAWMEILKALVVVFKLFDVEMKQIGPTVVREGFFNKATECRVVLTRRQ